MPSAANQDVSPADAALRFLADRIDYERMQSMPCSEEAMKLDRMRELLHRLGNPQERMPIVHVAGTKGKGSTAAMMAAVLSAAGYRTGLFTSPHLERVEERMAIDGQPCSAEELAALVELVRPAVAAMDCEAKKGTGPICREQPSVGARPSGASHKLDLSPFSPLGPTYFEIITAAALCHFARRRVDAAVLEVGLGGRLDSTNVCTPAVAIITSISFDHVKQLGATLAAIAAEKAGIIKPGVPVISGVTVDEPREVVRAIARQNGCRLLELDIDFSVDYHPPHHLEQADAPAHVDFRCLIPDVGSQQLTENSRELTAPGEVAGSASETPKTTFRRLLAPGYFEFNNIALRLLGRHQAANAALALAAVGELRRGGWTIPEAAVRRGLAEVVWPARIEVAARRPTVVLDAAHNAASIEALVEVLAESFAARRRLLVFATTQEKDLRGMLSPLLGQFDRVIFTRYQENPRGVPPEQLQELAAELTAQWGESSTSARWGGSSTATPTTIAATPADAWDAVHRLAGPDDLICVAGSFFLVAEMRRQFATRPILTSAHVAFASPGS